MRSWCLWEMRLCRLIVFLFQPVCLTKSFDCSAGNLQTMTLEHLLFSAHKEVCVKPDCQRWKWRGERFWADKLYLYDSIREKIQIIFLIFKMPCVEQCENALWNMFDKPPPKILYNNEVKEKRKHRQTHTRPTVQTPSHKTQAHKDTTQWTIIAGFAFCSLSSI